MEPTISPSNGSNENSVYLSPKAIELSQIKSPKGVEFRNLAVYGSGLSNTIQETLWTLALGIVRKAALLFQSSDNERPCILQQFNGAIHGGEMLLVLGRPGSGCSTFLKILAGETSGLEIANGSDLRYNGCSHLNMKRKLKGHCIYLSEIDVHFPELTIGQTLEFVAATRHNKSEIKGPTTIGHDIAAEFNLGHAYNTKIGNAMIRGCSGGEKRRTSIAEVFMIQAPFQCWDNSTRGLDSSTALNLVQRVRNATTKTQSAVAMSIYQTSDAVYKRFDKVILLYEGHQVYFGPAASAAEYFIDLGFYRAPRLTTADFLTSLTNPKERQVRAGFEDITPRTATEFSEAWRRSSIAVKLQEENARFRGHASAVTHVSNTHQTGDRSPAYIIPIHTQVWLCMTRGFQRLRNNYVPTVAGILGNTVISFVVSSVYYNLGEDTDAFDKRSVLLFFSLVINAYAPAFEIMAMWAQRPIVEKHNRYTLYYPFTESIAALLCDIPNKVATCFMFNTVLYFMTNLRRTADAFFTYMIFMFVLILTMSMFFRMVGSLSRTLEQTMVPVSVVILVFSAYTGFIIPVRDMVPWLAWLRRLNPIAFAYESVMINEFAGRHFSCTRLIPYGPAYTNDGLDSKICAAIGSQPGQTQVDGGLFLEQKYGFKKHNLWRNIGFILTMLTIFSIVHLLATQYIPPRSSRGEVLMFQSRRQARKQIENDERTETLHLSHGGNEKHTAVSSTALSEVDEDFSVTDSSRTFHWSKLDYTIKTKQGVRHILKDAEGWVKPGTLTAVMGVTGAGKTTLLDILACRSQVGIVTGDILLGNQRRDVSFQRKTGYVQQDDIHLPSATVREALNFSAELRCSDFHDDRERTDCVEYILDALEMHSYADAVIGTPGEGLNIEQRKRLSIAIEMVAKPELLLFLDEPTSGMDSQTAWAVCLLLRKLCNDGKTILVTIHQPSAKLFSIFDNVLLLGEEGKLLYFGGIGNESSKLIEYFERNGAPRCESGQNPAEWVFDVTKGSDQADSPENTSRKDWYDTWSKSEERAKVLSHIHELKEDVVVETDEDASTTGVEYAATFVRQLSMVVKRVFQQYWRDPTYLLSKAALCAGVTLCNGLSFLNTTLNLQGISNIFFSVFLFTQLFSTLDQQIIPRLISGRTLFEARERRSKTYSWVVMLSAHVIVELFWQTVAAVLIFITWWYPTGLWRNSDPTFGASERGALAFGAIWLFNLWISTFSQTVAVGIDHEETSVQIATLFFWLSLVFCGVLVPPGQLPRFWNFLYRASPITYFIHGSVAAGLANVPVECSDIELLRISPPTNLACGEYLNAFMHQSGGALMNPDATSECLYCPVKDTVSVLKMYGVEFSERWHNIGYLTVYVVFNIVVTFAVYWAFRERRSKARSLS